MNFRDFAHAANPLQLDSTSLPRSLVLMGKLIALTLLFKGVADFIPEIFLPYFRALDFAPAPKILRGILVVSFYLAIAGILLNSYFRVACAVLGGVLFCSFFCSIVTFSNNRLFCAALLIVLGLQRGNENRWMIWAQIALVYLGAGFSKLMFGDWRSGAFMNLWIDHMAVAWVRDLAHYLPENILARALSWFTIAVELLLVPGFLIRRFQRSAVLLGIFFHTALLIATHETFGVFYFVMIISYLSVVPDATPLVE